MVTKKHERQQDLWQAAIEKKENAVVIREFDVICSRTHKLWKQNAIICEVQVPEPR